MAMVKEMPVAQVAELLGVHDTRLWRIINHYVPKARESMEFSKVEWVGMDETASKRGHNYISLFFNMENGQLLFATPGRDKETVKAFAEDLTAHKGKPEQVKEACCDMSPAFITGVTENFPNANITFDRFHIMKLINEAVDQVRRDEAKSEPLLAKTRYIWLKNQHNLTAKQEKTLASLKDLKLKTARAYHMRLAFQDLFQCSTRESGEAFLKRWYFWATHSRLPPMIAVAKTIKRHWDGVINWFHSQLTTGLVEGFNSLLQAAKSRARGYRTTANLITMAYLIGGQLNFNQPT